MISFDIAFMYIDYIDHKIEKGKIPLIQGSTEKTIAACYNAGETAVRDAKGKIPVNDLKKNKNEYHRKP